MANRKNKVANHPQPTLQKVKTHRELDLKSTADTVGSPQHRVQTHRKLAVKALLFALVVASIVFYTDSKGYFNPDYTNDHTRRKWNAFYAFTKKNPVDVVLVGNSHLYTGVNPEHLSNTLGTTCFILASPGTTMTDTYYSLKEAIKVSKPVLAVVETFTLNDYDSHQLRAGTLSDQFKSFSARKDFTLKILSTPVLFASDHYAAAWSNTIRNHSFLFNDTAQIQRNIAFGKLKEQREKGLYLGRYIRFTSGIEDTTLVKYDRPGFKAYEYLKHMPSAEALKFLKKTMQLCEDNNVKLVLLTLPMYHRHVHDYAAYKKSIQEVVGNKVSWLDLQLPYDTAAFTPACFENTVSENQHMTYYGSLVAAYKLAGYIRSEYPGIVPDRSADMRWKQLFYASDGYYENYSPENDGVSEVLIAHSTLPDGVRVNELIAVPSQGAMRLMLKLDRNQNGITDATQATLDLLIEADNQQLRAPIVLTQSGAYQPANHRLFMSEYLDPRVKVIKVNSIRLD